MKYVQQDLFTKSGKVKKIDTIFEIELEDGSRLRVNEEDAKKIFDDLNKTFGYKYPYYYPVTIPTWIPSTPLPWSTTWTSDSNTVTTTNYSGDPITIDASKINFPQGPIHIYGQNYSDN